MKKLLIIFGISALLSSCGDNKPASEAPVDTKSLYGDKPAGESGNPSYDPKRGEGKFTKVDVPATLDIAMAGKGEQVFNVKCNSCHKTTDEKLVGPGWKGVTSRHSPEWIMNFVTNTDDMINKDPKVQAMLEICLVRMPNQNLSDDEARALYEFMRKNDGVK
jgi:cytochrome c5